MATCNNPNAPISSSGSHVVVRNRSTGECTISEYDSAPSGDYEVVFRGTKAGCRKWKKNNCS